MNGSGCASVDTHNTKCVFGAGCARAASGQAAAVPPMRVMNSRRLTRPPHFRAERSKVSQHATVRQLLRRNELCQLRTGSGLVSRVSPVQTALRNCTGDEGRPFGFGDQVADPKPPRAAVVKIHGRERRRSVESGLGDVKTEG